MDKKWQHFSALRGKVFSAENFSISYTRNQFAKWRRIQMEIEVNMLSMFYVFLYQLQAFKKPSTYILHSGWGTGWQNLV